MLSPKGYTQTITKDAYIRAALTTQKKTGLLKYSLPTAILAAAIALWGVITLAESGGQSGYLLSGIAMIGIALAAEGCMIYLLPSWIRQRAEQDFAVYDQLSNHANITFFADEMTVCNERLMRRVEYAKTRLCVETPERFVLVTDDGATVILEKSCFADKDNTEAFVRDVFARWYAKGR